MSTDKPALQKSMDLVSVVVVSYKKDIMLSRCLDSVSSQTHPQLEGIVILNGSDAVTLEKWKQLYPRFIFDHFPGNELYCKPQNRGIGLSRGEFVLCLNDDVILAPAYIEEALKAMRRDEQIGSVSGCLLREDGVTVDSTGFSWARSRKPYEKCYGKKMRASWAQGLDIFGANGAAAFYRRRMLEDIKIGAEYFDEDYGIYYEDFDLAWRARRRGWRAFYCPDAVATHKRGASTRLVRKSPLVFPGDFAVTKLPPELKARLIRNRYATIIKNDRPAAFLKDILWILFYEMRLLAYLLFFEPRVLRSLMKDKRYMAAAWGKRRRILCQWR